MKVNQYFFLKLKNISDSNLQKNKINSYVFNKFINHHYWWFLSNHYMAYKGLTPYKPFVNKTTYNLDLNYKFIDNKNNYEFNTSLYV